MTTTSELLLRWDQQRTRSRQSEFGLSEIGGCRRRAGYRLAGTEPSNAGGSVQAAMGSAIHDAVDAIMAEVAAEGDLVQEEVVFVGIKGHLDRYEAATGTVCDTKTTSSRWAEHLRLHGPDTPHLWQVHLYGAALVKRGLPVRRVQIDYLARDSGEEFSWSGPFVPKVYVRDALEWLRNVRETDLDMLPRDYLPDSPFCHSCRFADICWPDGLSSRAGRKVLFAEDPDARRWAEKLWQARLEEKDAKARAARAAGALEAVRPPEGVGRVQAGERVLDFRANGLYFAAGDRPQPAVGYDEGGDHAP